MIFWILLLTCLDVIIRASFGRTIESERTAQQVQAKQEKFEASVALTIHEITNVDYEKSTYKASVSVTIVVKDADKRAGFYPYTANVNPFSSIHVSGRQVTPREHYRSVRANIDGSASSISRCDAEIFCSYKLENYPFDVQRCDLSIFGNRFPDSHLVLSWPNKDAVDLRSDASPPNFYVTLLDMDQCDFEAEYQASPSNSNRVRFSCVRAWLQFSRPVALSVARFLVPTGAAVIVSFAASYVDRNNIQTRIIMIGFSSVLFCLIAMNIKNGIPSTAYLTAADFWIGICAGFIFVTFVEVIITNILVNLTNKRLRLASKDKALRLESVYRHERDAAKKEQYNTFRVHINDARTGERKRHDTEPTSMMQRSDYDLIISEYFHRQADQYSMTAARIELIARITLPIAFAISILVYITLFIFI